MSRNEVLAGMAQLDLARIEERLSMLRVGAFVLLAGAAAISWARGALDSGPALVVFISLAAASVPTAVNWARARRKQVAARWWYIGHTADVLALTAVLWTGAWPHDPRAALASGVQLGFLVVIAASAARFHVPSTLYAMALSAAAFTAVALRAMAAPGARAGAIADFLRPAAATFHLLAMIAAGIAMILVIRRAHKLIALVQDSDRRQARLVAQLSDGVLTCSDDQRAIEVNGAACELLGLQRSNVLGLSLVAFMPGPVAEVLQRRWKQVLDTGSVIEHAIGFTGSGGERWVDLHALKVARGGQIVVQLVIVDVTAERKLRQHAEQYDRLQALRAMALGMAHEFNGVFATIEASSFILSESTSPQSPHYTEVEAIRGAATRAARLAQDLLDLADMRRPASVPLDTAALLHRAVDANRPKGAQVQVLLEIAADTRWVVGDAGQLGRALGTAIAHGYRGMLDGGTLRVAACNERVLGDGALPPGDYVRIEVSDTGIGMPAEVAAKAFDPLAQGDDGGVARVGLANVRSTVVRHKGRVELKSAVGQGTTVSLLLPAGPSSAEDRERTAQERRAIGKGRKLLVVDDEPANRTSLARLLTLRGYEVLLADDGASAIRIAGEQGGRIDLVLLDLLMPEMNGKEVLEALRASHPSLKVLLVTGYSEHAMVQEAIEIGVAAVAYKPFDVPALLGQVQQLTAPAREATAGGAS